MKKIFITLLIPIFPLVLLSQWTTQQLSMARSNIGACHIGNKLLFAGGQIGNERFDVVDVYNLDTGEWSTMNMSTPKSSVQIEIIDGKAYFIGSSANGTDGRIMEIYDSNTDTWSTEDMPNFAGAMTSNGTKLYIARSNDFDIYDTETGIWTSMVLSPSRTELAIASVNDKVIVAGGSSGGVEFSDVNIYSISTGEFENSALSVARDGLLGIGVGNKAYFASGEADGFEHVTVIDIYNDDTGEWTTTDLRQGKWDIGQTVYKNKIYYGGGQVISVTDQFISDVDIYDTENETWELLELPTGRSEVAVIGANDKVFFAGGKDESADVTSIVEILDLTTSSINEVVIDESLKIFPVPAADLLNVESDFDYSKILIRNSEGRIILFENIKSKAGNSIDVSALNPGHYVVELFLSDNKRVVRSFVKI